MSGGTATPKVPKGPKVGDGPVPDSPNFDATLDPQGWHQTMDGGYPHMVYSGAKAVASIGSQVPPPPDTTQLQKLDGYTAKPPGVDWVDLDDLGHMTFGAAVISLEGVDLDVAPGFAQSWEEISKAITLATEDFQTGLAAAASDTHGWQGATATAAFKNMTDAAQVPTALATGATTLGVLAGAFSTTMAATRNAIVPNWPGYHELLDAYPEQRDDIDNAYNYYAQKVLLDTYATSISNITTLAQKPLFGTATTPTLGSSTDAPPLTNNTPNPWVGGPPGAFGGGPAGGLGALGGKVSGLGSLGGSPIPKTFEARLPDNSPITYEKLATPLNPTNPTNPTTAPTSSPSSGLSDLQGLNGLSSPLQSALGAATNAAQQAANRGAMGGANGRPSMPPEGAIRGLGPKGTPGSGGGGVGPRGGSIGKPASAPATAASSAAGRSVPVSRAGLIGGSGAAAAGPPGAGAPGAGQRPGGEGAQHQPSKVLRRRKNGEQIIGGADAVVAVLGEPAPAQAAKPDGK